MPLPIPNRKTRKSSSVTLPLALLACMLASVQAHATNGYFAHGVGMKAKGMGGVSIGLPQDTLAGGSNPATMAVMGNRIDAGIDLFNPVREAEISGSAGGFTDGKFDANETKYFPVPEFGYNRVMDDTWTMGISVFGHGGMNTDYEDNIPLFGTSSVGTDMSQLFVVPSLTYKVNDANYIGFAMNLVLQRLEITGAQNFAATPPSIFPGHVTNRGHDYSLGAGFRIGWLGQVTDKLSVGATYQTKTRMSELDDYKGLLAEQGDFDIPASYGIGLAYKPVSELTLAADIVHIEYDDVASLNNPIANLPTGGLGSNNGAGFGWDDQTVYKLGVEYAYSPDIDLRAGWNYGKSPIPSSETAFNIFAPATVEHHLTLGLTWKWDKNRDVTVSYMHALENKIEGKGSLRIPARGPGEVDLKMHQDSLGVAMSWRW